MWYVYLVCWSAGLVCPTTPAPLPLSVVSSYGECQKLARVSYQIGADKWKVPLAKVTYMCLPMAVQLTSETRK